MTAAEIEAYYITIPEIMADTGRDKNTVHNWLKYHKFMPYESVLGRPAVKREDYELFKVLHPELCHPSVPVA